MKGKVKLFNEKKGFGFIEGLEGDQTGWNFFIHYTVVPEEIRPLKVDQDVEFEWKRGTTGPKVTKIELI